MKLRSIALAGLLLITMRVMEECDRAPIALPVGGGGGGGSYTAPAPAPAQPAQPQKPMAPGAVPTPFKVQPSPSPSKQEFHAVSNPDDCRKMEQAFKRMGRKVQLKKLYPTQDPVLKYKCLFEGEDADPAFYQKFNYDVNNPQEYQTETEKQPDHSSRRRENWKHE